MTERAHTQNISGWGRFPVVESHVYRPEKRGSVREIFGAAGEEHFIGRGLGKSYGDASINGGGATISFERLDRMLDFDEETGVLRCEAGVTLASVLEVFVPRGFFLPVTPGTKFVTVGGAIAHDVHGKNHHGEGTFGQAVLDFELLVPSGDVMTCSRETNSDVFWATLGGAGLTGFILTARFTLQRVESAYMVVDYTRAGNLDEVLSLIDTSDDKYQYSVAWVDCLARGKRLGRSILMQGDHAKEADLKGRSEAPYAAREKRTWTIPIDFPRFVLNSASVRAFNATFYAMNPTKRGKIVHYDPYFYPLDVIHDWNRMYGKRGFVQYQFTVPLAEREGLVKILERVSISRRASWLAVLKKFGAANDGLLSYPYEGFTLTLDMAVDNGLVSFLQELDEILLAHNGRLYLAKDAVMTRDTFRAMYPRWEEFMEVKRRLDPEDRLSSTQARRLGLAGGTTS